MQRAHQDAQSGESSEVLEIMTLFMEAEMTKYKLVDFKNKREIFVMRYIFFQVIRTRIYLMNHVFYKFQVFVFKDKSFSPRYVKVVGKVSCDNGIVVSASVFKRCTNR